MLHLKTLSYGKFLYEYYIFFVRNNLKKSAAFENLINQKILKIVKVEHRKQVDASAHTKANN